MSVFGVNASSFSLGAVKSYAKNSELKSITAQLNENKSLIAKYSEKPENHYLKEISTPETATINASDEIIAKNIETKIDAGAELTDKELKYIKEKHPELYDKAVEFKQEREQYENQLKSCRSKEQVEQARDRKLQMLLAEAKSIKKTPGISKEERKELLEKVKSRFQGIVSTHDNFTQTAQYKVLPQKTEINKEVNAVLAESAEDVGSGFEASKNELRAELSEYGIPLEGEEKSSGKAGGSKLNILV